MRVRAFTDAPAVIAAADARRLIVHFFIRSLTNVANQHGAAAAMRRIVE